MAMLNNQRVSVSFFFFQPFQGMVISKDLSWRSNINNPYVCIVSLYTHIWKRMYRMCIAYMQVYFDILHAYGCIVHLYACSCKHKSEVHIMCCLGISWKTYVFFQPIFLPESKLETGSSPQTSKTFTFRSLRMQVKTRKLIPDSEMLFQVPRANVRIFLRHPEAPLSSPHSGGPSKHRTGQVLKFVPDLPSESRGINAGFNVLMGKTSGILPLPWEDHVYQVPFSRSAINPEVNICHCMSFFDSSVHLEALPRAETRLLCSCPVFLP